MKKILFATLLISQSTFATEKNSFTEFMSALFMSTCFQQSMNENRSISFLKELNMDFISLGKDVELKEGVKANVYGLRKFDTRFDLIFDDAGFCTILVYRPKEHEVSESIFDSNVTKWLDDKKYNYKAMPHKKSPFAETKEYAVLKPEGQTGIMFSFPHDNKYKHAAILTAF